MTNYHGVFPQQDARYTEAMLNGNMFDSNIPKTVVMKKHDKYMTPLGLIHDILTR